MALLLCLLLAWPWCGTARAESGRTAAPGSPKGERKHDARTDRLTGITRQELSRLGPYLERGPIALVEFANKREDELPAINLAAYVNAPAAVAAEVVGNPLGYPEFMRTIDRVSVVQKTGNTTVYDWQWSLAVFQLQGRHAMTVYPPPPGRPSQGYRITVDSISGDLGAGRFSLRLYPVSATRILAVLSIRMDMRRANYVVRQMAKATRSINRSVNISLAASTLLSLRRAAERRAGFRPDAGAGAELDKPPLDAAAVLPLLARGDLVLLDMSGDRLNQISVVGRIDHQIGLVRQVMVDTEAFGSALVPGSYARVVSRQDDGTEFEWGVDLPLVGASGRMKLSQSGSVVAVDAVQGALRGGKWRFQAEPLASNATLVVGWTRFDLRSSTWLLQSLINLDPYLGHGLSAAADIMLVRALRSRTRKLVAAKALPAGN
jgi:hypothetical protein